MLKSRAQRSEDEKKYVSRMGGLGPAGGRNPMFPAITSGEPIEYAVVQLHR